MTPIQIRSDHDVALMDIAGSDLRICQAARVSNMGDNSWKTEESAGLIRFLMQNRHGSPFEHGMMTFLIRTPIFVWREFMRHRIGFSYNEQSGRYMELSPEFYMPHPDRPLVQVGKAGKYEFVPGSDSQYNSVNGDFKYVYREAWACYKRQLDFGVAKEVARMCLPVSVYSSAYVTCNPRSLMSFLSLRTKYKGSTFPSFPQYEINQVADQMEDIFFTKFPLTHAAFCEAGRVSP